MKTSHPLYFAYCLRANGDVLEVMPQTSRVVFGMCFLFACGITPVLLTWFFAHDVMMAASGILVVILAEIAVVVFYRRESSRAPLWVLDNRQRLIVVADGVCKTELHFDGVEKFGVKKEEWPLITDGRVFVYTVCIQRNGTSEWFELGTFYLKVEAEKLGRETAKVIGVPFDPQLITAS